MKQALLLAGILIPMLIGAIIGSVWMWNNLGDAEMDPAGYVALVAGAVVTLLVGGGLMGLVFYSNRHGYDDRAGGRD
jgi:hypothetical protein